MSGGHKVWCYPTSFLKHHELWVDNDYRWPMFLFLHFSNCSGQSSESSKPEAIYREGQRGQRYFLPLSSVTMSLSALSRTQRSLDSIKRSLLLSSSYQYLSSSVSRSLAFFNYLTNFPGSWKTSPFRTPLCSFRSPPQYKWSLCIATFPHWDVLELGHNRP